MKNIFFLTLFFFSIITCKNANNDFQKVDNINENLKPQDSNRSLSIKLIFPYSKLEFFFGKNFIPVFNKIMNADSDLNEEYIIAYKKDNESNVTIVIFDIGKGDLLKTRFIYESNIFYTTNFSLQAGNLFYENDICLIIEGKSKENKNTLVIIKNENDNYHIIKEFVGDYSVILNYKEIETDKSKYSILKDVITINSSFSSTNTNIQKKEVYEWDYNSSFFKVVKSEEFVIKENSNFSEIYYSEEKYFNYISGFWYPQSYKNMIEKNQISEDLLNEENIQFIFFSREPKEVNIKYGDYIDKYIIFKVARVWDQQIGGIRLFLNEFSKPSNNYIKFMDVYLIGGAILRVNGPDRFFIEDFVKLPKPFLEYVNAKKEEINKKKETDIVKFLQGDFFNKDYTLTIKDYSYELKKNNNFINGYYRISFINNYNIISFIEDNTSKENTRFKDHLLVNQNYIINIFNNEKYFVLMPVKLGINDYKIIEIESIIFKKK